MHKSPNMHPYGVRIQLELYGNVRTVRSRTIQANLPGLFHRDWHRIMRNGYLPMSHLISHPGPAEKHALRMLYQYMSEVDRQGQVSAAITNGLEATFEKSHSLHGHDGFALTETFLALGELLDPHNFGCSQKIFKQMESFFLTHSEDILNGHDGTDGLVYISVLDRMSYNGRKRPWDMSPVLACLVREWDHNGVLPPPASRHLPPFSPKSKTILKALALQTIEKRRRRQRKPVHPPCHHHHHSRPPLTRRAHSHHGDFRPRSPSVVVPGDAVHPDAFLEFCANYPERVDLHLPSGRCLEDDLDMHARRDDIFLDTCRSHPLLEPPLYSDPEDYLEFSHLDPHLRRRRGRRAQPLLVH